MKFLTPWNLLGKGWELRKNQYREAKKNPTKCCGTKFGKFHGVGNFFSSPLGFPLATGLHAVRTWYSFRLFQEIPQDFSVTLQFCNVWLRLRLGWTQGVRFNWGSSVEWARSLLLNETGVRQENLACNSQALLLNLRNPLNSLNFFFALILGTFEKIPVSNFLVFLSLQQRNSSS